MKNKRLFCIAMAACAAAVTFANVGVTQSRTLLSPVSFGAGKLIGWDMKVSVNGAGAHYRSVSESEDISDIDVGGARANGGQIRPDPASRKWELQLSGPVEDDYSGSFTQACKTGALVTILAVSGMDMADVQAAGPWYVGPRGKDWAKGEAVIEKVTIKASYGGVAVPSGATVSYPDPASIV